MKRNKPVIIFGILAALLGWIVHPVVSIFGVILAGIGWGYLKTFEKSPPYTYSGQTRVIVLGVVDPLTLKRAFWNLILPNDIHPDQMINWVSLLQARIHELHGMQESHFVFNT